MSDAPMTQDQSVGYRCEACAQIVDGDATGNPRLCEECSHEETCGAWSQRA